MASAETIPPRQVETSASLQPEDSCDWPNLDGAEEHGDEWEMVPQPQVKFDSEAIRLNEENKKKDNPKILKHAQSSPNLRDYVIEDSDSEGDLSSSVVMVSDPPSVWSLGSGRLSFRDAILQKSPAAADETPAEKPKQHRQVIKKVKPTFVVKPIKRCNRSTGDLQAMSTLDEEVLGDTDAHEYYSRKAQGSLGRKNGMKTRPDEAKRLQMTMAKKNMQRSRQGR